MAASAARIVLSGRTARASGSRRIRAISSARPTSSPACGPPDELVAAERHEIRPGSQPFRRCRLVGQAVPRGVEQRAAAEVVDDDRPVLARDARDLDRIGRLDEPGLGEVRRVDAQDHDGLPVRQRGVEVGGAGPVRGADLDQSRAGAPDDLRDAHAATDLDQLPARNGHAPAAGQPDRQREGRGVVDRDQCVVGPGQRDEMAFRGPKARPATPGFAIELEQRIAGRGSLGRGDRLGRPRRAPEIGVEDDARRIEDRDQAAPRGVGERREPGTHVVGQALDRRRRLAGREPGPFVGHDLARDRGQGVRIGLGRDVRPGRREQPRHARGTRTIRRHGASVAGTRGSRTHRAAPSAAPLVLKTRGPTGTRPLPSRW